MKKGTERKSSKELSIQNIDREILAALNDEIDEETHFLLKSCWHTEETFPT